MNLEIAIYDTYRTTNENYITKVIDIKNLATLSNEQTKDRANAFRVLSNNYFIYDYDHKTEPKIKNYTYYYHKTHSGNYRIIVPVKNNLKINKDQYVKIYKDIAHMIGLDDFDSSCANYYRKFCLPPFKNTIIKKHEGVLCEPVIPSVDDFSRSIFVGSSYKTDIALIDRLSRNCLSSVNFSHITGGKAQIDCLIHPSDDNTNNVSFSSVYGINGFYAKFNDVVNSTFNEAIDIEIQQLVLDLKTSDNTKEKNTIKTKIHVLQKIQNTANTTTRYFVSCIYLKKLTLNDIIICFLPAELRTSVFQIINLDSNDRDFLDTVANLLTKKYIKYQNNYYKYKIDNSFEIIDKDTISKNIFGDLLRLNFIKKDIVNVNNLDVKIIKYIKNIDKVYTGFSFNNCNVVFTNDGEIIKTLPNVNDFNLSKLDFDYDADYKPNKLFEKCLKTWFRDKPQEAIDAFQEFCGYCLMNSRKFNKALAIYGVAGSGKSTLIEIIKRTLGGTNKFLNLTDDRELPQMENTKIWNANDVGSELRKTNNISKFKSLTDDGDLKVRLLHSNSDYNIVNFPKLIMTFNDAGDMAVIDDSIKERLLVFKFNHKIRHSSGDDVNLVSKILQNKQGIFNWCVDGYKRLCEQNKFTDYNEVDILSFDRNEERFGDIINYILQKLKGLRIDNYKSYRVSVLYEIYRMDYTNDHITKNAFGRIIKQIYKTKRRDGYTYAIINPKLSGDLHELPTNENEEIVL